VRSVGLGPAVRGSVVARRVCTTKRKIVYKQIKVGTEQKFSMYEVYGKRVN